MKEMDEAYEFLEGIILYYVLNDALVKLSRTSSVDPINNFEKVFSELDEQEIMIISQRFDRVLQSDDESNDLISVVASFVVIQMKENELNSRAEEILEWIDNNDDQISILEARQEELKTIATIIKKIMPSSISPLILNRMPIKKLHMPECLSQYYNDIMATLFLDDDFVSSPDIPQG